MTGAPGVLRFSATERALHWGFALTWLLLLVSGLPLMFPALRELIRGYSPVIGLRLHLAGAVLWIVVTLLIVAGGDWRVLRATWREATAFSREDWAWLRRFPRWLIARGRTRARLDAGVGRFNGGQKLNAVFTLVTSALLLVTGLALTPIGGGVLADVVTGASSVAWWRTAHRALTLLVLPALAGHVFLAALHPSTRHSMRAMLDGRVDADWAAAHHPRWRPDDREAA